MQTPVSSSPIIQWPVHPQTNQSTQFGIWDPGDAEAHPYKWVYSLNWNKIAHITYGNRGQRGKGITCVYWNKGPSFLCNRMVDIEYMVKEHKPHIIGLGELNSKMIMIWGQCRCQAIHCTLTRV